MIEERIAKVYFSPSAGRRYFTKRAALMAEATARIEKKYPTEKAEYDHIGCTYGGFHWTAIPRHDVLFRRYFRLIKRAAS